jgi:hypothetical protein
LAVDRAGAMTMFEQTGINLATAGFLDQLDLSDWKN